jgi:dephospho-CoA kinase
VGNFFIFENASMKLVGLTGGICCGKSTVVRILRSLDAGGTADGGPDAPWGAPGRLGIVDCDLIARDVVRPGAWGYRRVVRAFGPSILQEDGALDREKLGGLVFNDVSARKRLNAATHLPILVRMMTQILVLWVWKRCPVVVVDMPLLYEIGFQRFTSPYTVRLVVATAIE